MLRNRTHRGWGVGILFIFILNNSALAEAGKCDIAEILQCESDTEATQGTWTFGAGIGFANNIPRYIGAQSDYSLLLPFPYITYTSPRININRGGIRGKLLNTEHILFSVSLSGALPVKSYNVKVRQDMPDIEASFEIGPSLQYYFYGNDNSISALFFEANFRSVQTINLMHLGINSGPKMVARTKLSDNLFAGNLYWFGQISWEFVSKDYANYLYGVDKEFATEERTAFSSTGGYAGHRLIQTLRWQRNNYMLTFFTGYADIENAVFNESPLVEQKHNFYWGTSIIKIF